MAKDSELDNQKRVRMELETLLLQTESDLSLIGSKNSKLEDEKSQLLAANEQQRAAQEDALHILRACAMEISKLNLESTVLTADTTSESAGSSESALSTAIILQERVGKLRSAYLATLNGKSLYDCSPNSHKSEIEEALADKVKITSLTTRCEDLERSLANEKATVQELRNGKAELQGRITNATEATDAKHIELERLKHDHKEQLSHAETSLSEKNAELTNLEVRLKEALVQLENTQKEFESRFSEERNQLTEALERKNQEIENLLLELQQQKNSHDEATKDSVTKMEVLQNEVARLNDSLEQKNCECENITQELQQQKNSHDVSVANLESEFEELRSKNTNLVEDFEKCRQLHSTEMTEANARHLSNKEEMCNQVHKIQSVILRLECDNSSLQKAAFETVSRLEKNVTASRIQEAKRSIELQSLQERFCDAECKAKRYSQSMQTTLDNVRAELASVADRAKLDTEHLEGENHALSSEVELLIRYQKCGAKANQVEIDELNKMLCEKSNTICLLKQNLSARDSELCSLKQHHHSEMQDTSAEIEALRSNLKQTENARIASNLEVTNLSRCLQHEKMKVADLSNACKVREAEYEKLTGEICRLRDDLTLELQIANDEVAAAHSSLDEAREEISGLQERLSLTIQAISNLDSSLALEVPAYVSCPGVVAACSSPGQVKLWCENVVKTMVDMSTEVRDLDAKAGISKRQVDVLQESLKAKDESLRVYGIKCSDAHAGLEESNRKCQSLSEALKKCNSLLCKSEETTQKSISTLQQRHKSDLATAKEMYEGARALWRTVKAAFDKTLQLLHAATSDILHNAPPPPVTSNVESDLRLLQDYAESLIASVGVYMTEMKGLKGSLLELESANAVLTRESNELVDELAVIRNNLHSEEAELQQKCSQGDELNSRLLEQTRALKDVTNLFEQYKRTAEASSDAQCQFISQIENEHFEATQRHESEVKELNKLLADSQVENSELREKSNRQLKAFEDLAQNSATEVENLVVEKQSLEMDLLRATDMMHALGMEVKELSQGTDEFLQQSSSVVKQKQEALDHCEFQSEIIDALKSAKLGAEDSMKAAFHELEIKRSTERELSTRLQECENNFVEKENAVKRSEAEIARLKGDESLLRTELSTIIKEKDEKAAQNLDLREEICKLKEAHACKVTELNNIVDNVKRENNQLEEQVGFVLHAFEGLTSDVKEVVQESTDTEGKCRLVGKTITELNGRVSQLIQVVNDLHTKLDQRDLHVALLEKERSGLVSDVKEQESKLVLMAEKFRESSENVSKLSEALDSAQQNHHDELSLMRESSEKAQLLVEETKTQNTVLQRTITVLEAEVVNLKAEMSSVEAQLQTKGKELLTLASNAEHEKRRSEEELVKLKEEIEKLQQDYRRVSDSLERNEISYKEKCDDVATLESQLSDLRNGHTKELNCLRSSLQQLESSENSLATCQDKLEGVVREKAELENVLQQKTALHENCALRLNQENEDLSRSLEESKRSSERTISEMRQELQQVMGRNDEAKILQAKAEKSLAEEQDNKKKMSVMLEDLEARHESELTSLRTSLSDEHAEAIERIRTDANEQIVSASALADEQITKLKTELGNAQSELLDLQTESGKKLEKNTEDMQRVERELACKDEKLERALSAIEALEHSKKACENELDEAKSEADRLSKMLEETSDELREKRSLEQRLSDRIEALQNSISAIKERSDRDAKELQLKITEGEATVAELHQKLSNTRAELEKITTERDETYQSVVSYESANKGLHQELLMLKSTMKDKQQVNEKELGKQMDEQNHLRAVVEAKEAEISNLSEKLEAKVLAMESLDACSKSAEKALADARKELQVSKEEYQIKLEDLESLVLESTRKCEKLGENLAVTQDELKKAENLRNEQRVKAKALEEELQRLTSGSGLIPSLKSQLRQVKEDLAKSASELRGKEMEIMSLKANVGGESQDSLQKEVQSLQSAHEKSVEKQAELRAEIASLQDVCNRSDQAAGMYQKMMKKHTQCTRRLRRYAQELEKMRKKTAGENEVTDENERSGRSSRFKRRALSLAPTDFGAPVAKKARQSVGGVVTKVSDTNRGPMKNVTGSYMNY